MKSHKSHLRSLVALATLLIAGPTLVAGPMLFEATVRTTDAGPPVSLTVGASKLLDFVDQIVTRQGQFFQFNNRDYSGSLTLFGVRDAILVTENRNGTLATLNLTPIGVQKIFRGANEDDVSSQIEQYFLSDGARDIARFWKALAGQSAVGVTDGNPQSATALGATATFSSQGFTPIDEFASAPAGGNEAAGAAAKPRFGGLALGFNSGKFEAGAFSGTFSEFAAGTSLFRYFRLSFSGSILDVEGAKVYGVSNNLSVPIRFLTMSRERNLSWRVTPLAGLSARASVDLANGAVLWHAGLVNTFDYKVSPRLIVCGVTQFTTHKSLSLPASLLGGEADFDPLIDQQILKNGLRLVSPLGRRVVVEGFAIDSRFLREAAVKQFTTLGGALSFRLTQRFNVCLGANYDTGKNFKAYSAGLSSAWKW